MSDKIPPLKQRWIIPEPIRVNFRKLFLETLVNANGKWIEVSTIGKDISGYRMVVVTAMLKMGLIETKLEYGKLYARVTPDGRGAYARGGFDYRSLQRPLQMPMAVYNGLEQLAKDLGIVRITGRDVGDKGSIVGLLRHIVNRREAFGRWFKHITAEGEQDATQESNGKSPKRKRRRD